MSGYLDRIGAGSILASPSVLDYDHLPEAAFYMVGSIEEVVEKAEKMEKDTAA